MPDTVDRPCSMSVYVTSHHINSWKPDSRDISITSWTLHCTWWPSSTWLNWTVHGFTFRSMVATTIFNTWKLVVHSIKCLGHGIFHQNLRLKKSVRFIQLILLSKFWYVAYILPITRKAACQISSTISWYCWRVQYYAFCFRLSTGKIWMAS